MRFSSCWAMFSATSCASPSGCLISITLMCAGRPKKLVISAFRASMPAPPRPIIMPGLPVKMFTVIIFALRSMSIRLMPVA